MTFNNCIQNIVRAANDGCNCTAGYDIRVSYNLIDQFESAMEATGSTQRILVAIEVAYDLASDNPGRWAEPGLFKKFVDEPLAYAV
jgi:hypothetical protein